MKTLEISLFTAAELSPAARAKALQKWQETNEYDCEFVRDDAQQIAEIFGVSDFNMQYSGFGSQGDGACFTGRYSYAKGAPKAIREHAPLDTKLHRIADELQAIQARHFYGLTATLTHSGNYYHENSISFDVQDDRHQYSPVSETAENGIVEPLRDFMRWIYKALENDYNQEQTEEVFLDQAEANDWHFDENGKMYNV